MKQNLLLFFICLVFLNKAKSQEFEWKRFIDYGGWHNAAACVVADPEGNVYVTGRHWSTYNPGYPMSVYIRKYSAEGNLLCADTSGGLELNSEKFHEFRKLVVQH